MNRREFLKKSLEGIIAGIPLISGYNPSKIIATTLDNGKYDFTSYYEPKSVSVTPRVESYELPLDLGKVSNLGDITAKLTPEVISPILPSLEQNGFAVIDYKADDIVTVYKGMKDKGVPLFITSDSLLHLYHVQFDETLKYIEEKEFFNDLILMSKRLANEFNQQYNKLEGNLKEAAKLNTAFFATGLRLLNPTEDIPSFVEDVVTEEIQKIENHQGFDESSLFKYKEDYSQYKPRGHYTRSEELKRFFKAMMWYGRLSFLLKGSDTGDALISKEDAKIQTTAGSMISTSLDDIFINNRTIEQMWDRIYSVTAFYVGLADDLTIYEYKDSIQKVFGKSFIIDELNNPEKFLELKAELAILRSPLIYGGTGNIVITPPFTQEKVDNALEATKGLRFMGQRFIPDSYMFQQLVNLGYTGNKTPFTLVLSEGGPIRGFPRGLDVMALLGSERAKTILEEEGDTEYHKYEERFNELKEKFDSFSLKEWNKNLYWSWLYSLKPLLQNVGEGYPTFMRTNTWQNKQLNAALASWAELRHDTILYAKQSYTFTTSSVSPEPKIVGYVEPVPEFYSRLLALTEMTRRGLIDMNVLDNTATNRLQNLENILSNLIRISSDELENKELSEKDYNYIKNFGEVLENVVLGVDNKGVKTTLIADVHTDTNTRNVLEEGVGYTDLILVAYNVPNGILIGAGPTLSYYEFKWPMNDRLTDEQWRIMLESGDAPPKPNWPTNPTILTGVNQAGLKNYNLYQNYPNPFNLTTTIKYELPEENRVLLEVYNLLGQKVRTLVNEPQYTGIHSVIFDAEQISSGMYFVRMKAGEYTSVKKMMLLK